MSNTYTYSGPATRWSEGDPTAVDYLNVSRINSDHLYEALNTILVTSGVTSGAASTLVSHTQTNTQSPGNNSTRIATTAFVTAAVTAGTVSVAGSDEEVQYNNSGAFGASSSFTFGEFAGTNALMVKGAEGNGVTSAGLLNLWTAETTIVDQNQLGRIDFKAPSQTGSGDGVAVAASIWAEADATFSATVNETDLVFATGHSEAATEKFRITSQGEIGLGGANYGTDGYVLTSTGPGTAVAWEATGIPTYQTMSLSDTFKIEVRTAADPGGQVIWSLGWFKSGSGATVRWWLLGNTADVDTFARADAEFYIPTGDIADVPLT
jgi:hypothetical protein